MNPPQYLGVTSTTLAVFAARTKVPCGTYLPRGCLYSPLPNRLNKLSEKPHGERSTGRAGSASVYVAGAGNSAGQGMMHLSKYASRVTLFGTLRLFNPPACPSTSSRRLGFQRIWGSPLTLRLSTVVGRDGLEYFVLEDATSAPTDTVPADALFVLTIAEPHKSCLPKKIQRDEKGYVLTGKDLSRYGRPRRG